MVPWSLKHLGMYRLHLVEFKGDLLRAPAVKGWEFSGLPTVLEVHPGTLDVLGVQFTRLHEEDLEIQTDTGYT